jgi:hypothetical protein
MRREEAPKGWARRCWIRSSAALFLVILMVVAAVVVGYAVYVSYEPQTIASTPKKVTEAPITSPTAPCGPTATIPIPVPTPATTPTPTPAISYEIIEYRIEIVMEYRVHAGLSGFYIPTPDWNMSYWGECGGHQDAKAIVNVYQAGWGGSPIQSIVFNNTGGEYFIMHGGPASYSLQVYGTVCSPLTVTAFRFMGMRAEFTGPMSKTTPFTVPSNEWKIAFEVSGDPKDESMARFGFTIHREKENAVTGEAVYNRFGQDQIMIPSGWDRYYLKINSENCKWKIIVTAPP